MPAKFRKITAKRASTQETFTFNKSITPKGGKLGKIKLIQRKNGSTEIEILQDLDNNNRISKKEKIYEGLVISNGNSDKITDFVGKIKLVKQMHSCQWDTAKADTELIPCTMDYVPTVHSLKMVSDDGDKYTAQGLALYGETDVMW